MTSKDAEKGDDNTDVGSMVDMVDSYVSNADLVPNAGKIQLGMLIFARVFWEFGERLKWKNSNLTLNVTGFAVFYNV
jgi:hypothetical protein